MKKFKRKVLDMLMSNNSGSSLRQQLLDGAPFRSSLLYTAVPQRAASGTTGTFTRATTSTWQNNDGYMVTGVAGEIGFVGARRVRNLLTFTEDLTNAANQVARLTKTNATTLTETADLGTHVVFQYSAASYVSGNKYVLSCRIKFTQRSGWVVFGATNSASTMACTRAFNHSLGTFGSYVGDVGATFIGYDIGEVDSDGFSRISLTFTPTATTAGGGYQLYIDSSANGAGTLSYTGDTGVSIQATDFQLEDVTAQTTQTAGEYVSVGVESAPYYHGSFVDGIKCFPTDISGNPIPSTTLLGYQAEGARTNLCLQSNAFTTTWTKDATLTLTQNAVGPDGATSAWTLTDASAVGASYISQDITLTAASYTAAFFVKKTTGAQASYPVALFYLAATTGLAGVTIDTTNGVATAWTAYTGFTGVNGSATCVSYNSTYWRVSLTFTGTAAAWTLRLYPAGTTNATQSTGTLDLTAQGSAVFYGAQVELGSFASSPIATTTIAAARNADVLTYSSAGNILGTVGAAYAEVFRSAPIDSSSHSILCNATVNRSLMVMRSTTALLGYYDGTNDISSNAPAITSGATNKVAISYFGSAAQTAVRGTVSSSSAFDGNFNVDASIEIGNNGSGTGAEFYGNIRNVRIWQRQLSASELGAITS